MKRWQVVEIVRSNLIGNAAFKVAREGVHFVRRLKHPEIPPTEQISTIEHHGANIVIRHRRTISDLGVIRQCFAEEQYDMPTGSQAKFLQDAYRKITGAHRKPLIIDCGANIGASVLWFAHRYPQAHIVAIEPAPDNFALLQQNTASFDVDLRCAGIAANDGISHLIQPDKEGWSYRTDAENVGPAVQMVGFETLMNSKPASQYSPFILKIDIEGAESTLFSDHRDIFNRFPLILIEPHDWLLPGEGTSLEFFQFHASMKREFCLKNENVGSIRSAYDI